MCESSVHRLKARTVPQREQCATSFQHLQPREESEILQTHQHHHQNEALWSLWDWRDAEFVLINLVKVENYAKSSKLEAVSNQNV